MAVSLIQKIVVLGMKFDAVRHMPRRELAIAFDGILWSARWTNHLYSDEQSTVRSAPGHDETHALESLLRRLQDETDEDTAEHKVKGMKR